MNNQDFSEENNSQLESPQTTTMLAPVKAGERIRSIDTLRGFAVLGILMINIGTFALPSAALFTPTVAGGMTGLNFDTWYFITLIFMQKFMAIFSMLFGAGLVLMFKRAEEKKVDKFGVIYYRRIMWLLVFGLVHAYLMWYGDILFIYGICGLFLYLFRKIAARWLIVIGVVVLSVAIIGQLGMGFMFSFVKSNYEEAVKIQEAGKTLTPFQENMLQSWSEIQVGFHPTEKQIENEIDTMRDGYWGIRKLRGMEAFGMHVWATPAFIFWRAMGMMILGMALLKLGIFSAERSKKFYWWFTIISYLIGTPLMIFGMNLQMVHDFDFIKYFMSDNIPSYYGSAIMSLGHVGVIMLLVKYDIFGWCRRRLAAVGQMALSNYLMQTVICIFIFEGWGLGLFGEFGRFTLLAFVLGIWILQLWYSPIWLRHFRFGPAEWLWRSLTYWSRQKMHVTISG